jgi:hypothetical protein
MAALQQLARQADDDREERMTSKVTYTARPQKNIDRDKLRVEIMTQFQKARAYLAKW